MTGRQAIVLIGPPGSGKSSIAKSLMKDQRITAVETGNLLRNEVENNTETGRKIEVHLSSGKIVPTETVKEIVLENLKNKNKKYILFDGFPRVPDQIEIFNGIIREEELDLSNVIILDLPDEVVLKRLTGRRICEQCGAIFNIYFNPPAEENKCSSCGGNLKYRKDDTPEIVKERLLYYKENTLQVAEYFTKALKDETIEIKADQDIKSVTENIKKIIFENKTEV